MIFVDTSAILSVLLTGDLNHARALQTWRNLLESNETLLSNNYVLVESIVIIQKRLGIPYVRGFQENILPFLTVNWMDESEHNSALQQVFSANRRQLSLVDCSSFETMKRLGVQKAFTFDTHFAEYGFDVIP
jgi:predicted nucleic acid-binding protein